MDGSTAGHGGFFVVFFPPQRTGKPKEECRTTQRGQLYSDLFSGRVDRPGEEEEEEGGGGMERFVAAELILSFMRCLFWTGPGRGRLPSPEWLPLTRGAPRTKPALIR